MSVVRLIVATRSSGPPASGKIIKETPGSVASETHCNWPFYFHVLEVNLCEIHPEHNH